MLPQLLVAGGVEKVAKNMLLATCFFEESAHLVNRTPVDGKKMLHYVARGGMRRVHSS
jgi:hypothetical protein